MLLQTCRTRPSLASQSKPKICKLVGYADTQTTARHLAYCASAAAVSLADLTLTLGRRYRYVSTAGELRHSEEVQSLYSGHHFVHHAHDESTHNVLYVRE